MKYVLQFNYARQSTFKTAVFPTVELKKEYVAAETRDSACRSAWKQFYPIIASSRRQAAAQNLDAVRYAFYKRWREAHQKRQIHSKLKPVEDD